MGSAGHARGAAAGRDVAGKLYAGGATTSVVPLSGLKTEDLTPCLAAPALRTINTGAHLCACKVPAPGTRTHRPQGRTQHTKGSRSPGLS